MILYLQQNSGIEITKVVHQTEIFAIEYYQEAGSHHKSFEIVCFQRKLNSITCIATAHN